MTALRVQVGTARAGCVVKMRRGVQCPDGTAGLVLDVVRDWRGLPTYILLSDGGRLFFLSAGALVRCQST